MSQPADNRSPSKAVGATDAGGAPASPASPAASTTPARRVLRLAATPQAKAPSAARGGAGSPSAKAQIAPSQDAPHKNTSAHRAADRGSGRAEGRKEARSGRREEGREKARAGHRAAAGKGESEFRSSSRPARAAFKDRGNDAAKPHREQRRASGAASARFADDRRTGRWAGGAEQAASQAVRPFTAAFANQRRNIWRSSDAAHAGPTSMREAGAVPAQPRRAQAAAAPTAPSVATTSMASAGAADAPTGIRLNKRMADLGICSRREADDWITRGWVFVNGEPAAMGQRVQAGDSIHVDKAAYVQQGQLVTFLLHKPVGYVSGQPEDGCPSAATLLGSASRWPGDKTPMRFLPRQLRGLAPAGRLDIDSTGLLVLTQDGRIARQLIGADSTTDKEYLVRVAYATPQGVVREQVQAVFPPDKLALLRHGLSLDGQALLPAQVDWQNPEQLRFVLREGKKRQIRRMCEAVGLHVVGLKRVRIGRIMLGDLPSGQWRFLRADEGF
ncbi:MAG: pseudouridine synthase [Brachymonas sp.]|nr:pseudouridine synthase [Brachymonas sp.]